MWATGLIHDHTHTHTCEEFVSLEVHSTTVVSLEVHSTTYVAPEADVNPLLMVWTLEEVAVKPFAHFYTEILMVLNFQEPAVKQFLCKFLMNY